MTKNWEPDIRKATRVRNKPRTNLGIDAQSDERYSAIGKSWKTAKGLIKFVITLFILFILFNTLFSNDELLNNISRWLNNLF